MADKEVPPFEKTASAKKVVPVRQVEAGVPPLHPSPSRRRRRVLDLAREPPVCRVEGTFHEAGRDYEVDAGPLLPYWAQPVLAVPVARGVDETVTRVPWPTAVRQVRVP